MGEMYFAPFCPHGTYEFPFFHALRVYPALNVGGEKSRIAFLKFRPLPVIAADLSAAICASTPAIKFIVGHGIAHGIIEANFFANFDVSHCNEFDLTRKTCIRITGMIDIISFADRSGYEEMTILHLKTQTAFDLGKVDKGVPFINDAPENGYDLTLVDGLQCKDSVSTAMGLRAAFQLRRQIGTWLLGHSYNFLFFRIKD